ncbi:MAG: methylmalonyl-CoA mutase, N-terminal domain [Gaiellaceae bacterium]|nr:methylmalonyl-CoA mutase, N-terminal domain [Gaiellaceae bacterium]
MDERRTPSGLQIEPVYGPAQHGELGPPGSEPYTRGLREDGYRTRPWSIRQYAGYGTAEETNERFRYLLSIGQPGLSLAFDLPTQMGLDSDDPRAEGEVGQVGVAVDSLADLERIFEGIDLGSVSVSLTINAPAAVLTAMVVAVADAQGVAREQVRVTPQNDVLKEYVARGTYIFPPAPSLRLAADLIEWCMTECPRSQPISLSGYHMREAGATAPQEMAFALANAAAYVEEMTRRGIDVDAFASRLSWIFDTTLHVFEEVAKYRALRRLWARTMRERFGARDPRSAMLRTHTQTGGSLLTLQEPLNNIVRAALQAFAATCGGVQSLALSCFDEAIAIPTERAQRIAVRTQQILREETGVCDTADPFGGAFAVEALTDELERRAEELLAEVEERGGAVACIESGWYAGEIESESWRSQQELADGERVVVGVNRFRSDEPDPEPEFFRTDAAAADEQRRRLAALRDGRGPVDLEPVRKAARNGDNVLPAILDAVKAYATLGEICGALESVFGAYRPSQAPAT